MCTSVCTEERKRDDFGCMHEWFLWFPSILLNCIKSTCNLFKVCRNNWFDCDCFYFSDRRENCLVSLEIHLNPKDTYSACIVTSKPRLSEDSQRCMCPCCAHWPAHAGQCIVCLIPFLWESLKAGILSVLKMLKTCHQC